MATLGSLVIQMAVDTAKFQGDLGRAATVAEARMRNIRDTAQRTIGQLAAIGAAAAGAMTAALKSGIDRADDMRDLAQSVGLTVENLSRLQFAAKQSGLPLEALGAGLVKLSKHLKEVGDSRSVDQALAAIADKFKSMPDGVEKTALATEYFGKAGAELIPMLNEGSASLSAMAEQADRLGFTISSSTAAAADAFNDKLGELSALATGFKTNLAAQLLPTLNALANSFIKDAEGSRNLDQAVRIAATGMKILITAAELGRLVFQQLGEGIGGVSAAIVQAAKGNFREAWDILKALYTDGQENIQKSVTRILDVWEETTAQAAGSAPRYAKDMAAPMVQAAKQAHVAAESYRGAITDFAAIYNKQLAANREIGSAMQDSVAESVSATVEREAKRLGSVIQEPISEMTAFAEEAARNIQDSFAQFLFDPFKGGIKGMLAGFIDMARKMVAEIASQQILKAFFTWGAGLGGGVGSFFGSMLSGIGARAAGGPVGAGKPYIVGERGPELFVPSGNGMIIPNGRGAGAVVVNYSIDARGADADRIMSILPVMLKQTEDRTIARVRELQTRGRM